MTAGSTSSAHSWQPASSSSLRHRPQPHPRAARGEEETGGLSLMFPLSHGWQRKGGHMFNLHLPTMKAGAGIEGKIQDSNYGLVRS